MDDEEIIHRCRNNDRKAQNLLFKKYEKRVLTICRRYSSSLDEAKDLQQESFIKLFKSIKSSSYDILSLDKWVNRLAINVAIDHSRKQRRIEDAQQLIDSANSVEPSILESLQEEELIALIQSIPNPYRIVFNLFIIEGYNHMEVGEKLEIGESTSRSYLTRAKNYLKEKLSHSDNKQKGYG
ncbi:MAG: sigma-70 family RNA polymerase sigma factor [Cyclobacteriaceae bacterium]